MITKYKIFEQNFESFIKKGEDDKTPSKIFYKIYREDDPYGEEWWNDDIINWNDINIVHPKKDKSSIGKNVLICPDSQYYTDFTYNPKDTIGQIKEINQSSLMFYVVWDNGHGNAYGEKDLTLIEIEYI